MSMVHSVRADPSLNTSLCGGLKPYPCSRFGGTHGAVDVTKPGQFFGLGPGVSPSRLQVQGPESSTVGFGALWSLARPWPSFGSQFPGAPLASFSGGSDPKPSNSPFLEGAAASQTYRRMPRAFAYQTPSRLFLEGCLPDRSLCRRSSATRPSLWLGWVGVDFCFGGRRAEKAHYKS